MLKIVGYAQDRTACTKLRIAAPLARIEVLKLSQIELITMAGDPTVTEKVLGSDVVFMGRAASPLVYQMLQEMKGLGKYTVYDLDDDMFGVSPFSPHYNNFGIMPVDMDHPELGTVPMFIDGKDGFDVRRNRGLRSSFIRVMRSADCMTVSTPPLQKLYSRFHDNVQLVPNAIDFGVWKKQEISHNSNKIRVLYTGAANHREDWQFIRPVLERLQKEYKNWTLVLVGMNWLTYSDPGEMDRSRVEQHGWADIDGYPLLMRSLCCDIGLAPIAEIAFNESRSSIKWLEYSALKMATVATNYGPYARDCVDGDTALLARSKEEWYGALSKLLEDNEARKGFGERAYRVGKRTYDLDVMVDRWMDVFNQAENKKATGGN